MIVPRGFEKQFHGEQWSVSVARGSDRLTVGALGANFASKEAFEQAKKQDKATAYSYVLRAQGQPSWVEMDGLPWRGDSRTMDATCTRHGKSVSIQLQPEQYSIKLVPGCRVRC